MGGPRLTVMDIFKETDKSNCGECGAPSCMAFAALAHQGQKDPAGCPRLGEGFVEKVREARGGGPTEDERDGESRSAALVEQLKGRMAGLDLEAMAVKLGGEARGGRIAIKALGKEFELDRSGELHSICHVNSWVHLPILSYVVRGEGRNPAGEWAPFRDLKEAMDWHRFFEHRCVGGVRSFLDRDEDLFLDVLDIFGEDAGAAAGDADYAAIIRPLPKVPVLFRYWRAEGKFDSQLSILFDRTVEENLGAESTYMMVQGIVEMWRNIMARHGA